MNERSQPHQARIGAECPHCRGAARIRSSRMLSPLFKQLYMACNDPECGFTFGAAFEITHAISPSAKPNPAIVMPKVPPRRRAANDNSTVPAVLPGGLEVPPVANDDESIGEALG